MGNLARHPLLSGGGRQQTASDVEHYQTTTLFCSPLPEDTSNNGTLSLVGDEHGEQTSLGR